MSKVAIIGDTPYDVLIEVVDFNTADSMVMYTTFQIRNWVSSSDIFVRPDDKEPFWFDGPTRDQNEEQHPVRLNLSSLHVGHGGENGLIRCNVVLVDGLAYRPAEQISDVYDNLWSMGAGVLATSADIVDPALVRTIKDSL